VVYAFVDPSYAVPVPVLVFFALPLVFALIGGRVFCGGVCPLGAIQDLVLVRPARLPGWLAGSLGLLPPVYLGLAVLSVATGADFLVCRFDPFVGFFRFTAELDMAIAGVAVLAVATVVARPYCRFLCPYSVLLKLASRLSWRHLTTTPGDCVDCALCVKACPFGAVETPREPGALFDGPRASRRLALLLAAIPFAAAAGALVGYRVHAQAALMHPTVRVARSVFLDDAKGQAFLTSGKTPEQLFAEAAAITAAYGPATAVFGAYVGLVFAGAAAATMVRRPRAHYAPHRAHCLSCGRCIAVCPKEQEVRKAKLADRERRILATVAAGGAPDARG
jgi:NosR/NirI family transcriptional regulator, nitrous oxide reductase regulator